MMGKSERNVVQAEPKRDRPRIVRTAFGEVTKAPTEATVMFQKIISGTEMIIPQNAVLTAGCQPNFGCIALMIRWVKKMLIANNTTALE